MSAAEILTTTPAATKPKPAIALVVTPNLVRLRHDQLQASPLNPRKHKPSPEQIDELAESIASRGILQNLVTALLQLRQTDEALERIRNARARAPEDATLLALEGAALFHRGERELARERLREALARNPGEPTARAYWERLGRE